MNFSSHLVGNLNNETNFSELFLTKTQVSRFHKVFTNGPSANIKFSKTELPKMIRLGGFLRPFSLLDNIFEPALDWGFEFRIYEKLE